MARYEVQCIPSRDEEADGWWYVYDTSAKCCVWPREGQGPSAGEPSPRGTALTIAEAYNEAWEASSVLMSSRERALYSRRPL